MAITVQKYGPLCILFILIGMLSWSVHEVRSYSLISHQFARRSAASLLLHNSHRATNQFRSSTSSSRGMLSSRSKWTTSPSTTAARATNGNLELEEGVEVIEQDGLRITKKNEVYSIEIEVAGKSMSFETGKIGRQANGAVVAKTQDTMVYSTVCFESEPSAVDFTPLRIDYFARYSAIGQTIGAFHRRDSRGDDTEILVARLIDRPIRPMIDSGWQHDTQILTWVLSYDKTNGPEALAICAASAATAISEVPFAQPIAGVEVGMINGTFIVNPTKQEMKESSLQMTIAGTKTGVLMIEGSADFLTEAQLLEALQIGHKAIGQICDAIVAFRKVVGKPKKVDTLRVLPEDLVDNIDQMYGERIIQALSHGDKSSRGSNIGLVEGEIIQRFVKDIAPIASVGLKRKDDTLLEMSDSGAPIMEIGDDGDVIVFEDNSPKLSLAVSMEDEASELAHVRIANTNESSGKVGYGYNPIDVQIAIKKLLVRKLRQLVLRTGRRSDGRSREDVRPISIEHGWLPGPHGSALFTRGETQSISTATLGSKAMEARIETLDELTTKRFYLQYRFPPCSVGEVGKVTGTSRREVGHGNLAERALLPSLPGMDVFPYSIRAESLITESSGSSSMATVCGCSLAMLDAGVPLKQVVAGVAMGLILGEHADEPPVILTDILGLEDALGTMDFKVAGSEDGVTTFQLDIKCEGLTLEILQDALAQAKRGRVHILNEMIKALPGPKAMKSTIPRILSIKVDPEILGKIIGPKGKTVQGLIETHKLININLEDDGSIQIESFSEESNEAAKQAIIKITEEDSGNKRGGPRGGGKKTANEGGEEVEVVKGPPPEDGLIYRERPITGVHNFGVFVEVVDGYEGLIHVSELDTKKTFNVEELFTKGQLLDVKVLGKNEKGQLRLSRRAVLLRDSSANVASPIVATAIASTAAAAIAASVTSTPEVASSTVAN